MPIDFLVLTAILIGIMAAIHFGLSFLIRAPILRDIPDGEIVLRRTLAVISIDGGHSVVGGLYLTNQRLLWVPLRRRAGIRRRTYATASHPEVVSLPFAEIRTAKRMWVLQRSQMRIQAVHGTFGFSSGSSNFRLWVNDIRGRALYLIGDEVAFTPQPATISLSQHTVAPAKMRDRLVIPLVGVQVIVVVADILGAPGFIAAFGVISLVIALIVLWVQDWLRADTSP